MEKKTLAVFTGTRAEYGLLRPVIFKLLKSDKIIPKVVVTGAHLAPEFGNTVQEIEADGVPIAVHIPILKVLTQPATTADTVAYALSAFFGWLQMEKPDGVLLLGDRYEIFAAAQAAAFAGIPIAHISGGDVTQGAADDWYRHCVTKMAHLHFPSCEVYARRLVRMGEFPETVFNVGGLGDENIRTLPKMSRQELSESLGFDLSGPFGLVTFHPETAGGVSPTAQMDQLLKAMSQIGQDSPIRWLITKANADAGGAEINQKIDEWVARRQGRAIAFTSLGVKRYLSAMALASVVVGNSSSGVVETPALGVPTVNIGRRQEGRLICENVYCCPAEAGAITQALNRVLSPEFAARARAAKSPYNGGDTSGCIVKILEEKLFEPGFGAPKGFYDGPVRLQGEETR